MRIAVIDYGAGNLFSLLSALNHLGHEAEVVSSSQGFRDDYQSVVLPGVGAFPAGMEQLRRRDLVAPLRDHVSRGRQLLGICLGAQLLLSESEEFVRTEGLALIAGSVRPLSLLGVSVPAVGWSPIRWSTKHPTMRQGQWLYFVHSFVMVPFDQTVIAATTEREGISYPAAVRCGSLLGLQFHPEKSGPHGVSLLGSLLQQGVTT